MQAALQAGGRDNVTVVVVECTGLVSTSAHSPSGATDTAPSGTDDTLREEEAS